MNVKLAKELDRETNLWILKKNEEGNYIAWNIMECGLYFTLYTKKLSIKELKEAKNETELRMYADKKMYANWKACFNKIEDCDPLVEEHSYIGMIDNGCNIVETILHPDIIGEALIVIQYYK